MRTYFSPGWRGVWLLAWLLAWAGGAWAAPADVAKVKERMVEGLLAQNVDEARAAEWAKSINSKGRWDDVDYTEYPNKVVAYSPMAHQARTRALALAAAKKVKLTGVDTARLHAALHAALMDNVGREHSPTFNWQHDWYMTYIGAPGEFGDCLLLAQTVLSAEKMKKPMAHLRDVLAMKGRGGRSQWEGAGQNQLWVASVSLRKAALEMDEAMMRRSFESFADTIRFLPPGQGEGLRVDAAFHQHGNQIYSGGYGAWYVGDVLRRMNLAEGTEFEKVFTPEQVSALAYVVREGHRWMTYRNVMDLGARGRNISRPGNDYGQSRWVMETFARLDPSNAPIWRAWIEHNEGGPFSTPGNRHFWLSDFMVHRGKDWYVSAKVISTRTDGTETMNGENLLGFNLPLGTTMIQTRGGEYTPIYPIWDWSRLPGTTTELEAAGPSPHTFKGSNPFAGGASDGTNGVLAFASEYKGVSSKKAYFGIGDYMVCLGSDISGDGKNPIVTSVNQCFLKGQVRVGEMTTRAVDGGPEVIRNVKWVHHDEVGYVFFKPVTATVQAKVQTGSWRRTSEDQSDQKISGEVFSLWLDHGRAPRGASYAYLIAPRVDSGQCARVAEEHGFEVLRNDEQVQAVRNKKLGVVGAVFHKPGRIELDMGTELSVDNPAIVLVSKSGGRQRVFVSDPLQNEKKIGVRVGSTSQSVVMGDGEQAGRTVEAGSSAVDALTFAKRPVASNAVARVVRKVERLDRPGDEKSREFVLISRPDGKVDAYKTVLAEIESGVASVELVEGRRMAWQATRVAARAPWYEAADFAAGHAKADAVLAQYDTLLARYPEARPVLAKDYAVVKGLVDEQKARVAQREKARQEALALRYDPTKAYTLEQLEPVVAQLTAAAADYPADRPVLERALAGFQGHLDHLRAGDVLVDGKWRLAADLERERQLAEAMRGAMAPLESRVTTGGDVWRTLMLPLAAGALCVVLGLVMLWRRTFVSVFLGLCLVGGPLGYAWYARGASRESAPQVVGGAESATPVARVVALARVAGSGGLAGDTNAVTVSDAEVNAFLAARVAWTNQAAAGPDDVVRKALWVEGGSGRLQVAEQVTWQGADYVVRHEVVLLDRPEGVRVIRSGTKVGELTVPEGVGDLFWGRLEPELKKLVEAAPVHRAYRLTVAPGQFKLEPRPAAP